MKEYAIISRIAGTHGKYWFSGSFEDVQEWLDKYREHFYEANLEKAIKHCQTLLIGLQDKVVCDWAPYDWAVYYYTSVIFYDVDEYIDAAIENCVNGQEIAEYIDRIMPIFVILEKQEY